MSAPYHRTDHGEVYKNHFDYFMYQIVKPYSMTVEEYHYAMKMYAEKLKLMQPPSYKKCQTYAQVDWDLQEIQVDERCICRVIFNGLPKPYQRHLSNSWNKTGIRWMKQPLSKQWQTLSPTIERPKKKERWNPKDSSRTRKETETLIINTMEESMESAMTMIR